MAWISPLCSRNPHDKAVVVRRAQLGTKPGHPLEREMSKLGRIICIVERAASEGWEGSSQTILLARRGRTIRMCSLDARSEDYDHHNTDEGRQSVFFDREV